MQLAHALVLAILLSGCVAPAVDLASAPGAAVALACVDPCGSPIDATRGGGFEPHVAVHPTDPRHVVAVTRVLGRGDAPVQFALWFDVHVSRDGGASWNVTQVRFTEAFPHARDPDAPNGMGDPVLAFLPDGTLLLTGATLQFVAAPGASALRNVRLFVLRSTDGGTTFEPPVIVAEGKGVYVAAGAPGPVPPVEAGVLLALPDKPWLATGPDGTALLAWSRYGRELNEWTGNLLVSASRDGGRSWSAPTPLASGGYVQGSSPALGSDGAWHVAYVDLAARETHVATSRDEGSTWSDVVVAPGAWMPSLAVARAPGGDRLLLAFAAPGGAGDPDAVEQTPMLSWSDDGGATWTAPLALDAPEAPGRVLPSVAADGAGVAYVTFAHPRGPDASEFRAIALRPGAWRADLVLDDAIAGPTRLMGDYLGLGAGASGAYAVWSTTRDGKEYDVVGAGLALQPGRA